MSEIIFHIGMHKTGTTTLQYSFRDYQEEFSKLGIYFPNAARIAREGHHNLVYELISAPKLEPAKGGWEMMTEELRARPEPFILISSESLSGYRSFAEIPQRCAELARTLGRRPRVIAYLRPQPYFIESIYAQNASTGYTAQHFDRFLLHVLADGMADYGLVLKNWHDTFGDCEIHPFPPRADESYLAQFVRAISGAELPDTIKEVRANERRGIRAVEFGREATVHFQRAGVPTVERRRLVQRVSAICARRFPNEPAFTALDHRLFEDLKTIFAASNAALVERYPHLREHLDSQFTRKGYPTALNFDSGTPALRADFINIMLEAVETGTEEPAPARASQAA
ncbi:MAG: hypothetical protein Q4G25_05215 [Paracoccus sp. (in: a-proteobacteria)]|nr:hypothetical protein [Paracoccus sp. (in: a-proteobacteria)]